MRRTILALALALMLPTTAHAQSADVVNVVSHVAYVYGLDERLLFRVARCESSFNPLARNPMDGSAGLFQFQPQTFAWASEAAGYGGHSVYDVVANAMAAGWLISQGGIGHWTCR